MFVHTAVLETSFLCPKLKIWSNKYFPIYYTVPVKPVSETLLHMQLSESHSSVHHVIPPQMR